MAERPRIVLGIDPGFASTGYAFMAITQDPGRLVPVSFGVIQTKPSAKKHKLLASDDQVRRAREIVRHLANGMKVHQPVAICAESMSYPRFNSQIMVKAAAQLAMCWGFVACIAELADLPVLQVSPQELKLKVCGSRTASKEDVAEAIKKRVPGARRELARIAEGKQEHPIDAMAACIACMDSEMGRMLRTVR